MENEMEEQRDIEMGTPGRKKERKKERERKRGRERGTRRATD